MLVLATNNLSHHPTFALDYKNLYKIFKILKKIDKNSLVVLRTIFSDLHSFIAHFTIGRI